MADIKVQAVRIACNTSTGTQDFTISGFGTPKAAIFIFTSGVTDNTAAVTALMCIGMTDGTRQWSMSNSSRNGSANTVDWKRAMSDQCIHSITVVGGMNSEASFDSWITDGVRINWTDANPSAYLMTVILLGGSDLTARVDTIDLGTVTSAQTYSSLSSEADIVIGAAIRDTFNDTSVNAFNLSFGLVHNNRSGTITQRCQGICEGNNQTEGKPNAQMMDDQFLFGAVATTGAILYEVSLSNFTSSGFDFTCNGAGANGDNIGILSLNLGGASSLVGTYEPPTTATTSTISTSFTPQFCLLGMNACTAVDTLEIDGDGGVFGISAIDATRQNSSTIAIEDLSGTTDTQSLVDDTAVQLPAHDGASNLYTGTLSSFDSSGVNLSFSTANGTTRKWIYVIIGEASAATTSLFFRPYSTIRAMLRR